MESIKGQQGKSSVQLTMFNVLADETDTTLKSDEGIRFETYLEAANQRELQPTRQDAGGDNGSAQDTDCASSVNQPESPIDTGRPQLLAPKTCESFQVIWCRLSFEVTVSKFEKLLSKTVGKAKALWCANRISNPQMKAESDQKTDSAASLDGLSESESSQNFPGEKRIIFDNLNGYFNSGEITAILGPSGAGKTSLLNAITGQVDGYRGTLQLNGGGRRKMRLSIIPQKDYLVENLTVRENLLFSSQILNTDRNFDHEANILRVVKMLNLSHCIDSSAGNISGGEYKRVSIGQELLRQPDVLILDEPTSGLDSLNCKHLIQSLATLIEASRKGAINPIAIVMTIHQPDVDIFQMFDHVYCMARGGRVIFDGHPSEAMDVIRQHSGLSKSQLPASRTQLSVNPANLLIEIASEFLYGQQPLELLSQYQLEKFEQMNPPPRSRRQSVGEAGRVISMFTKNMLTASAASNSYNDQQDRMDDLGRDNFRKSLNLSASTDDSLSIAIESTSGSKQAHLVRNKRLNAKVDHSGQFLHQTRLLTKRAFTSATRDPLMTVVSLLFHLTIPLVMWLVYPRDIGSVHACPIIQRELEMTSMVSNKTVARLKSLQTETTYASECASMFYLCTYAFSMCSASVGALAFPLNMHILLKEVRNGWYSLPCNVLANTIASFPFEVVFPAISIMMIYLLLGMPSSHLEWRLWAMALAMALIAMISHTHGLVFGALCMDSAQTAIFLASSFTLPQVMLSGFTARITHMPYLLQKLSLLSLYRYSSETINIIRFGFDICPCNSSTDEYLRRQQPTFSDIPSNMNPLFAYYLSNGDQVDTGATASADTVANSSGAANSGQIPGISYDLKLNASERSDIISRLQANELNLSSKMADMMSRSFAYGREVSGCDSVRSQILMEVEAPPDEYLPRLFAGMLVLLVAAKIALFAVVKFKIGSRI